MRRCAEIDAFSNKKYGERFGRLLEKPDASPTFPTFTNPHKLTNPHTVLHRGRWAYPCVLHFTTNLFGPGLTGRRF